ncbi:hypothetical protein LV779_25980 [Streptomyces thinghirensis]|nr:hypothetical protein [Streptomyces thinghirensis]
MSGTQGGRTPTTRRDHDYRLFITSFARVRHIRRGPAHQGDDHGHRHAPRCVRRPCKPTPRRQPSTPRPPVRPPLSRPHPSRPHPSRPSSRNQHPPRTTPHPASRSPSAQEPSVQEPFVQDPATHEGAVHEYGDPVGDLVRAAVADRPLEEVVDLITMLEGSPPVRAGHDRRPARGRREPLRGGRHSAGRPADPPAAPFGQRGRGDPSRGGVPLGRGRHPPDGTAAPHPPGTALRAGGRTGRRHRPTRRGTGSADRPAGRGRAGAPGPPPDARHLRAALDGTGDDGEPGPDDRPAGLAGAFTAADRRGRERSQDTAPGPPGT